MGYLYNGCYERCVYISVYLAHSIEISSQLHYKQLILFQWLSLLILRPLARFLTDKKKCKDLAIDHIESSNKI
jgi:hypothetical protein